EGGPLVGEPRHRPGSYLPDGPGETVLGTWQRGDGEPGYPAGERGRTGPLVVPGRAGLCGSLSRGILLVGPDPLSAMNPSARGALGSLFPGDSPSGNLPCL